MIDLVEQYGKVGVLVLDGELRYIYCDSLSKVPMSALCVYELLKALLHSTSGNVMVDLLVSLTQNHFSHLFIGSLSDIIYFSYQALSSTQPSYLHALLSPVREQKHFRSSNSDILFTPRVKTNIGLILLPHHLCGAQSIIM